MVGLVSTCDVPDESSELLEVAQDAGRLTINAQGNAFYTPILTGGIFDDGSFDVGGFGTELGATIEITARAVGAINDSGVVAGEVKAFGTGRSTVTRSTALPHTTLKDR